MGDANFMSATALADLARAGSAMASQSFMQVNFEVHHVVDEAGYLKTVLERQVGKSREYTFRETLTTSANGGGLVVGTYAGTLHEKVQDRRQGTSLPVELKVDDKGGSRIFRGTAWPNPTFIYESAQVFEGIITVGHGRRSISYKSVRAVAEVLHEVSRLAVDVADAPILLLQTPVQAPGSPFTDEDDIRVREEYWPRSNATAVRFAFALRHPSAELRMELAAEAARYCQERGYGFSLNDIRLGHGPGNWFSIVSYDQRKSQATLDRLGRGTSAGEPYVCVPLTFVGPARVGSTHAILSFMREYEELGVLSCSITSLNDLAFIHIQLAANDVTPKGLQSLQEQLGAAIRKSGGSAGSGARVNTPQDALPAILPLLAAKVDQPRPEVLSRLAARAGNYQVLAGPAMVIDGGTLEGEKPIWLSWKSEGSEAGLAVPIISFLEVFSKLAGQRSDVSSVGSGGDVLPNIEYLVCRDVGDLDLRAKGKVSVRATLARGPGAALESDAARLCAILEDAWRVNLAGSRDVGNVEVAVAHLEHRLGQMARST